jgi:hypothetical protein
MLKSIKRNNKKEVIKLGGQFSILSHRYQLPVQYGICIYVITVIEGKMRLCLTSYTMDRKSEDKSCQFYELETGDTQKITLDIKKHHEELYKLVIFNNSKMKALKFSFNVNYIY